MLGAMLAAGAAAGAPPLAPPPRTIVHFVPNSYSFWSDPQNWTTSYGPAFANILLQSSNFVPCRGGPFALCYYSGPSSGTDVNAGVKVRQYTGVKMHH
jgi:hypothetical protein